MCCKRGQRDWSERDESRCFIFYKLQPLTLDVLELALDRLRRVLYFTTRAAGDGYGSSEFHLGPGRRPRRELLAHLRRRPRHYAGRGRRGVGRKLRSRDPEPEQRPARGVWLDGQRQVHHSRFRTRVRRAVDRLPYYRLRSPAA